MAAWQQNDLLIQGMGGRPQLFAAGAYILGKGIWVCAGDNIIVDNIAFYDAAVPSENGAGIRLDGIGLTVRNCYFQDNENGILAGNPYAGDILIEYSEFNSNGFGDGFTHNMYIGHVNNFTIQYCYTHHTDVGHNIKTRAQNSYILYNRIMDEETGNSSRLIDIPNGGYALVMGNTMMQGENALNNNCIGYGLEGLSNTAPHEFYCINNTIINKRVASCNYIQIESGTDVANISNNIFAGDGTELSGTSTVYSNNYYTDDISAMLFVDEANFDYGLLANSPAIDSGLTQSPPLVSSKEYVLDLGFQARPFYGSSIDVGAYEFFIDEAGVSTNIQKDFLIYPNPSFGSFIISSSSFGTIKLYDANGQLVLQENLISNEQYFNIQGRSGLYLIELHTANQIIHKKIILQ